MLIWVLAVASGWGQNTQADGDAPPAADSLALQAWCAGGGELEGTEWVTLAERYMFRYFQTRKAAALLDCLEDRVLASGQPALVGYWHYLWGRVNFQLGRFPDCRNAYARSVAAFEHTGDSTETYYAMAHEHLAGAQERLDDDFTSVIDNFRTAIALYDHQRDTSSYLYAIHTMAQSFGNAGLYTLAERERQVVFDRAQPGRDDDLIIVAHLAASIEGLRREDLPFILHHLQVAEMLIIPERHVRLNFFLHRFYLGYCYRTEALECGRRHFAEMERIGRQLAGSPIYQQWVGRDRAILFYLEERYGEAERIASRYLGRAEAESSVTDRWTLYELLRNIHDKRGNHEQALRYAIQHTTLKDSVRQAAQLRETDYYQNLYERNEARVQAQRRAAELSLIQVNYKNRLKLYSLGGVLLLLAFAIYYLNQRVRTARRAERQKSQFARDLLVARGKERESIARDLHDRLGHDLLLLQGEVDREAAPVRPSVSAAISKLLSDVRNLSHQLHDPGPEHLGFNLAVQQLIDRLDRGTEIFYSLDISELEPPLDAQGLGHLFAILQEGLQNVLRHSAATAVRLEIASTETAFRLRLLDNGRYSQEQFREGLGLRSMRERASMIGAKITLSPAPGEGTMVLVEKR